MILRLSVISIFASLLIACNGSSGDNGDDPFGSNGSAPTPVVSLQLAVLDSRCQAVAINSFTTDQSVCLQATLTEDGTALSNRTIAFSTGIGSLSVATRITNAQGIAEVSLTSELR